MATDFEALIPVGVASELIAAAERESVAMRLGNVQWMPEGIESVPVVSVEPDAEWNALGARKKATTIEWSALRLESEELACILAIPQAWIDDTGFPVWDQVRNRVASAFAKRIDETILFAVAPEPSSFPASDVVGVAGAALSGASALEAIDKGLAAVEAHGLLPTGIASSSAIGTAIRKEYRSIAVPPDTAPALRPRGAAHRPRARRARRARAAARHAAALPAPGVGPLNLGNFRRRVWSPALEAAGVRTPATPYDLRDTFASNALAAGVTVFELEKVMGTSVRMIERHYGALLEGAHAGIAGRLDVLEQPNDDNAKEAQP
jgi:hypothetical protein